MHFSDDFGTTKAQKTTSSRRKKTYKAKRRGNFFGKSFVSSDSLFLVINERFFHSRDVGGRWLVVNTVQSMAVGSRHF